MMKLLPLTLALLSALTACVATDGKGAVSKVDANDGKLVVFMSRGDFGGDCEPRFGFEDKTGQKLKGVVVTYVATQKDGESKECSDIMTLPGAGGGVFCSFVEPVDCDGYESIVITKLSCSTSELSLNGGPDCLAITVVTGDPLLSIKGP